MHDVQIHCVNHRCLDDAAVLFEAQLREHQMAPPTDALQEAIRSVIDNPSYGFVLLGTAPDGAAVGVAYASSLLSFEHGGVSGWLEELYVTPAWRGRGIGSRLLQEVVKMARELGWRALDLEVDVAHERAIPLYLRHGFHPHARSRFFLELK